VRVVVADDAVILREGLARLLKEGGFEVVGLAADGRELLELVERCDPDVAIIDIRMPPTRTDEGLQAAKAIRRRYPRTAILVLSQHIHARYALELLSEGPTGLATSSRSGSPTWQNCLPVCAGSVPAGRCSTRLWSASS